VIEQIVTSHNVIVNLSFVSFANGFLVGKCADTLWVISNDYCAHNQQLSQECLSSLHWICLTRLVDNDIVRGNNLFYHPSFSFVLFELLLWFLSFMLWYVGMLYAFIFFGFVRREVWIHQTSLTLVLFIEVPAPRQQSERSWFCVLWVSISPLSTILIFYFGIVLTVWYFIVFILLFSVKH
jgi:hypothetical protein